MLTTASTDYVQGTIEIFGAVITLVIGLMLLIITGNKKRSEKNLFVLVLLASLSLIVDAGWYIFDGNSSNYAVVLNHLCNFAIFLINPLMVAVLCGYLCQIVLEKKGKVFKPLIYGVFGFSGASVLVVFSNIFYKWMYSFDAQNIYHRLDGWFLYATLNCIAIALLIILVLVNFRAFTLWQLLALSVFLLAPFIGIALQTQIMGISFIQIGIAIGCVAILIEYIVEMFKREKDQSGFTEERRNFLLIECILMIMVLCISASVISCIVSVNLVSNESSQQSSKSLIYMVSDVVNSNVAESVDVSRSMAQSQVVIEALTTDDLEGSSTEESLLYYMNRLKSEYGFQTIFVASERTHAYYTSDGFSRIMDTTRDSLDAWYGSFKSRGVEYALNVDYDKDDEMSLCVFVNVAVYDDDGNFIGICGVASSIEDFISIISRYEEEYDLKISLINMDGLTQISSNRDEIESVYINVPTLQPSAINQVYYERNSLQAVMSKYMEALNWYLIVADNNPDKLNVFQIVLPAIIVFIVGITLLMVFIAMFKQHNNKNINNLRASKRLSETDGLTGLFNRYALEELEEQYEKNGMPSPLSVAMVDVNGLKTVNDNLGHEAGDELIKGAADCMLKIFESEGMIYRFGGDEFLIVIKCDEEKTNKLVTSFKELISSWHGKLVDSLSVSVGVVVADSYPNLSFVDLKNEADKLMYQEKEEYYIRTGKTRR